MTEAGAAATATTDAGSSTGAGGCGEGDRSCSGNGVPLQCDADGVWHPVEPCDDVLGFACDGGECVGPCSAEQLAGGALGCEYYATATAATAGSGMAFAVSVTNPHDVDATVVVTRGDAMVTERLVPAGDSIVIELSWVSELLDATEESQVVVDAAYHLRVDQPVSVQQWAPIDGNAISTDASALIPTTAWDLEHVVIAEATLTLLPGTVGIPGFYAVVASADDTTVEIESSAASAGWLFAGGGLDIDGSGTVTLSAGDVLQVLSAGEEFDNPNPVDVTGTTITSDKPVQVLGGHACAAAPAGGQGCDHLEEVVPPLSGWGTVAVAAAPAMSTTGDVRARFVRVVAGAADVEVQSDPDQGPIHLDAVGDSVVLGPLTEDLHLSADGPIAASQVMTGASFAPELIGDTSLTVVAPLSQWRDAHVFATPTGFVEDYATIVAPLGASVTLDGAAVEGLTSVDWSVVGGSDRQVLRIPVAAGPHRMTADQPIGVELYGYGADNSYWLPSASVAN